MTTTKPVAEAVRRAAERISETYFRSSSSDPGVAQSQHNRASAELAAIINAELATAQSTPADICAEMARGAAMLAAKCNSQDGDEFALGAAAQYNAQADALREAERRIRAATVGGEVGWRPIESAPKDSSWILGITQTGRQMVVRWGGGAWEDDNRLCRDPKYWQPLPAPPQERKS